MSDEAEVERRPVCLKCHREVEPWNWALTPIKPPRQPIVLVAVCFPACKELG